MDSGNVTTGLLIAQGPGGNYNENVRLPGSTAVISFNTSGTTGAGSYNIVSQTNFQIRNAGGAQVFILDQSGNLTMSGTVTAPTFSGALSGNATTATAAAGATFLTQANATWGARLQIGGNGDPGAIANIAVVQATDGNLHMDNGTGKSMYLNYYRNGVIYLNGGTYYISSNGSQYNGNAATATSADNIDGWGFVNTGSNSQTAPDTIASNGISYTSVALLGQSDGALYSQAYSSSWQHQIFGDYRTGQIAIRGKQANSWQAWRTVIDSGNIGSQKVDGAMKLWAVTHPSDYYMVHNWTGSHWYLTVNHPSPVRVGYADSASSATSAGYSSYLSPHYNGGVISNPQTYFNNGIGLKVAMTGHWSVWSDTLWINGYTGGDVPDMCALHFLRNGTPRMAISTQSHGATSYGTIYEVITSYNIAGQTVANTTSVSSATGGSYTWSNIQYFLTNNGGQAVNNSNSAKLQAYSTDNNSAFMSFHRAGHYAINMGLDNDNYFRIGGWSAPANRLQLNMTSGDLYISGTGFFGITGAAGSLAYNATADNIYNSGWFRNYGDTGLYNQDYAAHFRRNASSSYGTWEVFGYNKGGYAGINLVDANGRWSNLMFENGSGGLYQENGQSWLLYFFYGNDCLGLSGSDTYDWVRVCSNGKHRITNDSWCDATSWAYTFSNISDGRLKENIVTVDSALDKVLQLRGVYYNWIIDTENKKHIGLIAQETAAVCPEVVNYHDETDTYSVNYSELSGLFVESTKELNQKLIDANARIELLETKLNQLLNA
jgi:hypothetical protein